MKKEIFVIGDIEMGAGTITDDFISDKALAQFITSLGRKRHGIDLILNGDTFDFLKCPIFEDGKVAYPRYVTPRISLEKLNLMQKAHPAVFSALANFVQHKNKIIYFIIGNHDYDLVYREVQRELRKVLRAKKNIFFQMSYKKHGVYVEHGQQYDVVNKMNLQKRFLHYHGKKILNLPWSFGILHKYMSIKENHPFLERISPRITLFSYYRPAGKKISKAAIKYFLSSIFYYPVRYFSDPTYYLPKGILGEIYRGLRNPRWELDNIMDIFKLKKKRAIKKYKILVLGHIHSTYIEEKRNYVLIHSGTWRDEYTLDSKTGELISKTKNYVQITVDVENPKWKLVPYPIKRSIVKFNRMIKDENKFILLAAKEESYAFPL